jgi:chemosensory pili system protein ChpA (sensor histidine kinase/response regulator)
VNAQKPVVLIIDDHPEIRKVMALLLQKDCTVIHCDGEASAVLLAAEKQPALILCDAVMPHIAGHELVALFAAEPQTAHIPILVVTGKTEWEDWKDQPIAGMLRKPFVAEELIQTVQHIINTPADNAAGANDYPALASAGSEAEIFIPEPS